MRHGQVTQQYFVSAHVHQAASFFPAIAPARWHVRAADRSDVARGAIFHRQPIEVAAVFGCQPGDERRSPQGSKAAGLIQGCQAAVERVDEDHFALPIQDHVMHVQVASGLAAARHVHPVIAIVVFACR